MPSKPEPAHVRAAKKDALRAVLVAAQGHVGEAAAALEIDYATAMRQIRRYGLREWLDTTYQRGTGARSRWGTR